MSTAPQIGVLGAGAWGTALAQMLAADGTPVRLWAREPGLADAINATRFNQPFLPGVPLAEAIAATGDLAERAGLPLLLAGRGPPSAARHCTALAPHADAMMMSVFVIEDQQEPCRHACNHAAAGQLAHAQCAELWSDAPCRCMQQQQYVGVGYI